MGQGRQNVMKFLKENSDIYDTIYMKAREALGFSVKNEKKEETKEDPKDKK
jgi:hypothetical protein